MESELDKRQAYISQQLMVLRESGLVEARKDGMKVFYSLADGTLNDLLEQILGPILPGEPVGLIGCPCEVCGAEPIAELIARRKLRGPRPPDQDSL
jgi:ArsR family transcriptional regulator